MTSPRVVETPNNVILSYMIILSDDHVIYLRMTRLLRLNHLHGCLKVRLYVNRPFRVDVKAANEVVNTVKSRFIVNCDIVPVESRKETVRLSPERLLVL